MKKKKFFDITLVSNPMVPPEQVWLMAPDERPVPRWPDEELEQDYVLPRLRIVAIVKNLKDRHGTSDGT